jgi:3-phenylpropionate/trans-cinnamate dioxygenase ferredoxin subunit
MLVKLGPFDLQEGELRSYEVGTRYVLVTCLEGAPHAIDDTCNHAGCLLSGGWLEGRAVVCPCHEYKFDVVTGQNVTVPRLAEDQTAFETKVDAGEIVVELPPEES